MFRLYNSIVNAGVTGDLSFSDKLRTQLCNQSILIATTFILLHIVVSIVLSYPIYEITISLLWVILFGTCFCLNYKNLHVTCRILLIAGTLSIIGLIHHLYGPQTRLESLYISITILGLFLLKRKHWLITIVIMLTIYFSNVILYPMIGAKLEEYIVQSATIQYFIFSIVLSLAIIGKVLIENKSNHKLLKLQNSKMQTQNEELMRFNYIISHDLKEPIRSIVGLTGLLAKKTNGENSDISSEIVTLGTRLNNMVNDIVKFQEIDKISQNIESFSLSEIIENIKSNISKTLTKSDAVITHHGVDQISGLKTCVYLILKNLIENSIKYNNKKPVITIQCSTENCHYSITVTDNGIGIPDIYQDEVFVMFKRLNQIKSEKGSGLGLSISKKIAQKDGATLEILKSGNEGTTFILKKPLSDNLS